MCLQQHPTPDNDVPMDDYKLHPAGIIATLEKLLADSCSSSDRNSELGTLQGPNCSSEKCQTLNMGSPRTKNQASTIVSIKKRTLVGCTFTLLKLAHLIILNPCDLPVLELCFA